MLTQGSTTLTVAENSLATPIGIPAPTDTLYAPEELSVTVTAVPANGTVLLGDGTTPVSAGQTLTVSQLTGLSFVPDSGTAGSGSSLSFTVTDPDGATATGSVDFAIAPAAPIETTSGLVASSAPTAASLAPAAAAAALPPGDPPAITGFKGTSPASGLTAVPQGETPTARSASPQIFQAPAAEAPAARTLLAPSEPSAEVAAGAATLAAGVNAIVLENQKPGTPESIWAIDPGDDSDILQGFTTQISTNLGGTVQFKVDNRTGNPDYRIDIYRLGWYGGDGARLVTTINHDGTQPVVQPDPLTDPSTGLVDAGNWSVTDSWQVPSDLVSGVYVANVIGAGQVFQIPFVIRDDSSQSDIVFQTADQTWQAYNGWGGNNLYGGSGPGFEGAAYAVSYNRPITTRDSSQGSTGGGEFGTANDMVFAAEYPAIQWLEENGYDVSYVSGLDVATNGSLLLNHKVYMDAGHDEYWTNSQVANVEAARDAGVNLMFLSGNEIYWQTRFEPAINGASNRTLVTYKDTHANALIDPTGTATGTYMDARFAETGGMSGIPSNALSGQVFSVDADRHDTIRIPYDLTQLRFWRNTGVADTQPGQTASLVPGYLGYEWDSSPDNGFRPAGLIDLSSTTLNVQQKLLDYGNTTGDGSATHNLVEYRDPESGALVFGAGTVFWTWGLSDDHDQVNVSGQTPADPDVQQAMVNLFADMGVQPATLEASLVIASQSTDHTAPTSSITNLSTTSIVEGGSVTVSGSATDSGGGVIGGVEVSTDGGNSWHPASGQVGAGSVNWTYTFKAGAPGTSVIQSRAVDDSLNVGAASASRNLTVTPSSRLTLFSPSDTPAVLADPDPSPVEVGVRFTPANDGQILGIRFYKGPGNTGAHLGDLWTANGTLLASATFTNETASGWQEVTFAQPVNVQAGQTYVASYHTNVGHYSNTDFYFQAPPHSNGALTAQGNGLNGYFAYGPGPIFPSNVAFAGGNNYWVDVVYADGATGGGGSGVLARDDSGFSVTQNGTLSIPASALLANDTDAAGLPLSITGVSAPSHGTATWNPRAQTVTFTPTSGYAGAASFTYSAADSDGGSGSAQVAVTVNYPRDAQSLFGTEETPVNANENDSGAVELGMKFTPTTSGTITGIRFYKGTGNTGTHVADLWSASGTRLATATFSNETATGWQQVNFSSPVPVTAGQTYIAAYHTPTGHYAADGNYFATSHTNGDLTAPASAASGGNGVFVYGGAGNFPNQTFGATNYWVDVVFNAGGSGTLPPVANDDSGFSTAANTALSIEASALLANDTDPNGLALSITGVGNPSNGAVSYDSSTQTVRFTPANDYTGPASFTYTVGDSAGGTDDANVALSVINPSSQSLFALTDTPTTISDSDPSAVELGVKFTASTSGTITGIRFYKGPQNTGTHVADLWSASGTRLATATFTNETASGWQQVNFSSPVAITAGQTYIAAYHTNTGHYSADGNYFATAHTSGALTAPSSSQSGGNGVYAYGGANNFPDQTFGATNYWVDVVFDPASGQVPVANDDSGFSTRLNTALVIPASALLANDIDPAGLPLSISSVGGATNGTVTYNASAANVTFTPTSGFSGSAGFTYTVADSSGGSDSANVALTVTNTSTESLFAPTFIPSTITDPDPSAVELGMKFTAATSGTITGIRFYKGSQNTGTHIADLWSASGTRLATATFTNETASGWQQVDFATPVAITAGQTYIAAYHTNVGHYSADTGYFSTSHTSGDLTAPSSATSGGNGVYAYGSTNLFPNNTFNATSYAVDVVFQPALAS